MRDEMREGNRSILSRYLQEQLGMCLERGNQAMLFLNRRGYAGFVACRSCGTVIGCVITAAIHSQIHASVRPAVLLLSEVFRWGHSR